MHGGLEFKDRVKLDWCFTKSSTFIQDWHLTYFKNISKPRWDREGHQGSLMSTVKVAPHASELLSRSNLNLSLG